MAWIWRSPIKVPSVNTVASGMNFPIDLQTVEFFLCHLWWKWPSIILSVFMKFMLQPVCSARPGMLEAHGCPFLHVSPLLPLMVTCQCLPDRNTSLRAYKIHKGPLPSHTSSEQLLGSRLTSPVAKRRCPALLSCMQTM